MADGPDKFDETAAPPASLLEPSRFTFAGKPLAPYSFARQIISDNLVGRGEKNPADQLFTLALIYTLLLEGPAARAALLDQDKAREEFFAWVEAFDSSKYGEAVKVANAVFDEPKKASVSVEAKEDLGQKKTDPNPSAPQSQS